MKHINLTKENKKGLAKIMVTQESNNFGDQILTMKQLVSDSQGTRYETIATASNQEGSWMETKQMKSWYKQLSKGSIK